MFWWVYIQCIPISPRNQCFVSFYCNWTFKLWPHVITGEFDGYLIIDRGYLCQPYWLTVNPWPWSRALPIATLWLGSLQDTSQGRDGHWFKCLHRLRVTPERAWDIIVVSLFVIQLEENTVLLSQWPIRIPILTTPLTLNLEEQSETQYIYYHHFWLTQHLPSVK